ncbi:hypothetical protein DES31_1117 [Otariodibacter oris]|uniref:Uncharacterized protein n=2 Tax=Otariodibacter oris TaxID=1032623 RepID=A0A420XGC1_9PAST|nr:hypothetical protein DES31_1117 [Otariodibacter oris]
MLSVSSVALATSNDITSQQYKYKKEKVDEMLKDVLKTEHQLVPKYCRSIAISNVSKEELSIAIPAIKLAVLANSTSNENVIIYLDKNQEAFEDIKSLLSNYPVKIDIYENSDELVNKVIERQSDESSLDERRLAIITKSTKMRETLASTINSLGNNPKNIIIDNFAYLYNTTRSEYDKPSEEEIKRVYDQIK